MRTGLLLLVVLCLLFAFTSAACAQSEFDSDAGAPEVCEACDASCLTCNAAGADACTSCVVGEKLSGDNVGKCEDQGLKIWPDIFAIILGAIVLVGILAFVAAMVALWIYDMTKK